MQTGFTLVELMITVALAAILLAVGLPAFGDFMKNNRMTSQANDIIASFHYARNESINRNVDVQIEPLVDGTDWSAGWRVRVDGNNDGDFDDVEDDILRNFQEVKSSDLQSTEATIIYGPDGQADNAATLTLRADDCTGDHKRKIEIALSGHIRLDRNDMSC